jgi:hypothetical protein
VKGEKCELIHKLLKFKKSDKAVFLGTSQSINNIKDWQKVFDYGDVFSINNWCYHPTIVPTLGYQIECKWYDIEITKNFLIRRKEMYKCVVFLTTQESVENMLKSVGFKHVFLYHPINRDNLERDPNKINANYIINPQHITKSYFASVTGLFEIMYRMGYEECLIFGMDFNHGRYFWYDWPEEEGLKRHAKFNKDHEHKNPDKPHNTAHIIPYIYDFNKRWMKLVIGYQDTVLYPGLEYKNIFD